METKKDLPDWFPDLSGLEKPEWWPDSLPEWVPDFVWEKPDWWPESFPPHPEWVPDVDWGNIDWPEIQWPDIQWPEIDWDAIPRPEINKAVPGTPALIQEFPSVVQIEVGTGLVWAQGCAGVVVTTLHLVVSARCVSGR